MEQMNQTKPIKVKPGKAPTVAMRVRRETKRRIAAELARVNKKDFGRKVRADDLIVLALSLVEERHITGLQERSLSNADRIEQRYQAFVKDHGPIAKDVFLGKLLAGETLTASMRAGAKSSATEG